MHHSYFPFVKVVAIYSILTISRYLHSMTASQCYFDGFVPNFFDVTIEYPHQCLYSIISNDLLPIVILVMKEAPYLINTTS
jgi:hypothetical protein